ncbi:hypothetical protein H8959_003227 [Pygathrix nigripes]
MHCHAELRLSSPGQLKAARRRYKTFMIDEILSKETCDYFEKLSLYSVCPSLVVRPKPLHSCTGEEQVEKYEGKISFGNGPDIDPQFFDSHKTIVVDDDDDDDDDDERMGAKGPLE